MRVRVCVEGVHQGMMVSEQSNLAAVPLALWLSSLGKPLQQKLKEQLKEKRLSFAGLTLSPLQHDRQLIFKYMSFDKLLTHLCTPSTIYLIIDNSGLTHSKYVMPSALIIAHRAALPPSICSFDGLFEFSIYILLWLINKSKTFPFSHFMVFGHQKCQILQCLVTSRRTLHQHLSSVFYLY